MRIMLTGALLVASLAARGETPGQIVQAYADMAARLEPGFGVSASRGEALFRQRFAVTARLPACSTCHTDNPAAAGRHAITGKDLRPLAPAADGNRLRDPAKVEKWLTRNCREVLGRPCAPAEKADLLQFLVAVR